MVLCGEPGPGHAFEGFRVEAWSTVTLGSRLGLVVSIGSPWNCEWKTRKTPGRGSPDVELAAGLNCSLYSVNY